MNWNILITILIIALLLRIFWAHIKANKAESKAFKNLAPKDKLAVLKECLLNNPTEQNLENLENFLKTIPLEKNLDLDIQSYKPLMNKQLALADKKAGIEEWDNLYIEECIWIDKIKPLEFEEAKNAQEKGDERLFIERSLEGISRLYSDNAIEKSLKNLEPFYPKAFELLKKYKELVQTCEKSEADDTSLKKLRQIKEAWIEDLLDFKYADERT